MSTYLIHTNINLPPILTFTLKYVRNWLENLIRWHQIRIRSCRTLPPSNLVTILTYLRLNSRWQKVYTQRPLNGIYSCINARVIGLDLRSARLLPDRLNWLLKLLWVNNVLFYKWNGFRPIFRNKIKMNFICLEHGTIITDTIKI